MKTLTIIVILLYLAVSSSALADSPRAEPASQLIEHSRLIEDARGGDPEAQYTLAHLYLKGRGGVDLNVEQAILWLERAAGHGHPDSALDLALIYLNGEQVVKDAAQALRWLIRAAELGQPDGQYFLGLAYQSSDPARAVHWLKEAESAGHPEAGLELKRICSENRDLCR